MPQRKSEHNPALAPASTSNQKSPGTFQMRNTASDVGNWKNAEINRRHFIAKLRSHYLADFVEHYAELRSNLPHWEAEVAAEAFFDTLLGALFDYPIRGDRDYGDFDEAKRAELVDSFYDEVEPLMHSLDASAEGDTLLWSAYGIGRFAAERETLRKAAGVTGKAQPLNQTKLGSLLDRIGLTTDPKAAKKGLLWEQQGQIWNAASREFAAQAKGDVHIFLPDNIAITSVFWNVELTKVRERIMAEDSEKEKKILVHHLTPSALAELNEQTGTDSKKEADKLELMSDPDNWLTNDIMVSGIKVPEESEKQKKSMVLEDKTRAKLNAVRKGGVKGQVTGATLMRYLKTWSKVAKKGSD